MDLFESLENEEWSSDHEFRKKWIVRRAENKSRIADISEKLARLAAAEGYVIPELFGSTPRARRIYKSHNPENSLYEFVALNLVDDKLLRSKYEELFLDPEVVIWRLRFEVERPQPLSEYVSFLSSLTSLYELISSLQYSKYFSQIWIQNQDLQISDEHQLRLVSVSRASPDDIKFEGLGAGLKAIGDALSIGKQYENLKAAQERVRLAKVEAREAEVDLEEKERQLAILRGGEAEDMRILIAQKRLELRGIELAIEEMELKARALKRQEMDDFLSLLHRHAPVFEKMPEAMRVEIIARLTRDVSLLQESPFHIIGYGQLNEPQPQLPSG